ncbi:response regulator [Shewanella eurypsychrophilus]|uniref:Response regulator n=1 Tax=Shewanella eurypsychrophilus TaxID=2593656 RepID=A0ABX6V242_9GAMM|nr:MULTISPECIES: response regulator [Shewanella]QFU21372.1 response regulator [Shewanella sp. YLB-09]QPG56662.1 response regulator [Shewanella eurypsychrophilus]
MYIRFDEFSIDTLQLEFIIKGHPVPVDERVCLLFSLLIENYPSHCNKQICLDHIWPDTIVSDMSLSKLVSDARKVFKQAGCSVAIIQTVHGRGYRLSQELGKQLANNFVPQDKSIIQPISVNELSLEQGSDTKQPKYDNGAKVNRQVSTLDNDSRYFSIKLTVFRNKLDALVREWPRVSSIFCSIIVSVVVLYALASTHVFDHFLISGHSEISEKEIVYSEPVDAIGRVLWVDDYPENNSVEREFLRSQHLGVYSTTSSKEALLLLSLYQYDVIISDMGREEDAIAGLKLLEKMRADGNKIPFYIYTLNATEELIEQVRLSDGQGVAVDSTALFKQVMQHF